MSAVLPYWCRQEGHDRPALGLEQERRQSYNAGFASVRTSALSFGCIRAENRNASKARTVTTAATAEIRKTNKRIRRIIGEALKRLIETYVSIVQNRRQMFQPGAQ